LDSFGTPEPEPASGFADVTSSAPEDLELPQRQRHSVLANQLNSEKKVKAMPYDYLAGALDRLTSRTSLRGEDAAVQWTRIEMWGEEFLLTRQTLWPEGALIYAHRPIAGDTQRVALMQAALEINLGITHPAGPTYCMEPETDQIAAVLRIPYDQAHAGDVLARMEGVARQFGAWTAAGLLQPM
jgi:hypothetical protein